MKKLLCLMGGALLLASVQSQQVESIDIGDSVPNVMLTNVINYKTTTVNLFDLKDRLVILDFMNTGCSSCIGALPRIDSIAKGAINALSVFVSIPEGTKRATTFMTHNPIGKKISLPFITNDSLLEKYFPHEYISHLVWIYKGKVVAITHSDYVTEKNVKTVLSGIPIRWPVKRDITDYDYASSLMTLNNRAIPELSIPEHTEYTAFTSHMENITPRYTAHYDSVTNTTRVTIINYSIRQMYLKAFGLPPQYEHSRIASPNSLFLHLDNVRETLAETDWRARYTFCYETLMDGKPPAKTVEEKLKRDINTQFGLNTYMKDSIVNTWILEYDSSNKKMSFDKFENYATAIKAHDIDIHGIIYEMNHTLSHPPVIGIKNFGRGKYMKIETDNLNDLNKVNKMIVPYGLSFKVVQKRLPFLHIEKDQQF